jgi:hypothetical protein
MNGGTAIRAGLAAAMTAVLSLTAAGAAAAAPTARPGTGPAIVQVTGSVLETALLPPSAFGTGYQQAGAAADTGGSLRPASPARSVRGASCADIEGGGSLAGYGDTAEADLTVTYGAPGPATVLVYQDVAQFPGSRAARSFFEQVLALYRRCGSFASLAGFVPVAVVLTGGGITTTSMHGYPAFRVSQELETGELGSPPFGYVDTLFVVAGTDVYEVMLMAGSRVPVPGWMPTKLISRVRALYR